MTEVVHHDNGAGAGLLVGGLLLVAIVFLLLIYGIPAVTNQGGLGVGGSPEITVPSVNMTVPEVNVQPPQQPQQ